MEPTKNPAKTLEDKKSLFFKTGLVLSLLLVFNAFQWKAYERTATVLPRDGITIIEITDIPVIIPERPLPPPPPDMSQLELVADDEPDIPEPLPINFEATPDSRVTHHQIILLPEKKEEPPDTHIFVAVEEMPEFPGGVSALMRYLAESTRYPVQARNINLQGTVFVRFVVEPDGSISNVALDRGIGGGCDEEALRVISSMPPWKPGRQSGRPVRVAYSARIVFRLQ